MKNDWVNAILVFFTAKYFYLHLVITAFLQNFQFLAFKMTEFWLFCILTVKSLPCQNTSLYFPDVWLKKKLRLIKSNVTGRNIFLYKLTGLLTLLYTVSQKQRFLWKHPTFYIKMSSVEIASSIIEDLIFEISFSIPSQMFDWP